MSTHLKELFADVILPMNLPKPFTYRIPEEWQERLTVGSRVLVQFGNNRILTGFVNGLHHERPQIYETKDILDILDEEPLVNRYQLDLFNWMADYYLCTPGEVINAAIPAGLKLNNESKIQLNPELKEGEVKYTPTEAIIIEVLRSVGTISYKELAKVTGIRQPMSHIKNLLEKKAVFVFEEIKDKYTPKVVKKLMLAQEHLDKENLKALFAVLEKKPKQLEILLKYLHILPVNKDPDLNTKGILKSSFNNEQFSASALATLIKNGIFEEVDLVVPRFEANEEEDIRQISLSDAQKGALDQVEDHFKHKDVVLLFGITGSGKTEIFTELARKAIEGGSQVLYMLPEIAITTQLVVRLRKYFGNSLGIYHSKFSDNERVEVYRGVASGRYPIVIGVRSSIFLPFDNLGLVIVDEEHEGSYKQQDPAPRYHARDTALMLARLHNAKTLLGTATPSIESYYQCETGKWGMVELKTRFAEAQLPEIQLVDLKRERKMKTLRNSLSLPLVNALHKCLELKEQAILFQNRRGYATYLFCEDCGFVFKCSNCDVSLTYHQYGEELRCHYCGYREEMPATCVACGSAKIKTAGSGTEKVEEDLKLLLPGATVQRMDLDTTRKKTSYETLIKDFETGKTNVLVGTQMVSKGLDFDKVNLVGIFDADRSINFPDFRAHERTFQLLTQVSGRAGRREKKGTVLIQTNAPEQEILQRVVKNDYEGMYLHEIVERKKYKYPPFVRLVKVIVKNTDKSTGESAARYLADKLSHNIGKQRVLGPQPPLVNKVRNQFIQNIFIKLEREQVNLKLAKAEILKQCNALIFMKSYKNTIVIIDVDPA